jgi:hypothetical protein
MQATTLNELKSSANESEDSTLPSPSRCHIVASLETNRSCHLYWMQTIKYSNSHKVLSTYTDVQAFLFSFFLCDEHSHIPR